MIIKDFKYFYVYLLSIIFESLLVIFSIILNIFTFINMGENKYLIIFSVIIFLICLYGLTLGVRSIINYKKTPNILAEIKDDLIIIQGEENKISDFLEVYIEKRIISRNSKVLKLVFNDKAYILKDILNINESYLLLKDIIKGDYNG